VFGKSLKLFNLFGFSVKVDVSWIVIAVLVAWSLSVGFFPQRIESLSSRTYWLMGIVGALGLFASIIFHEMCHSLVARQFGLQMKGITLFIFGGVAEMEEEPPSAKAEFVMAIAGPISSIILATGFYAVYFIGGRGLWPQPINAIFGYLGMINGVLAVFNMVPAFPLDGGRMLRAALWHWKSNIKWATRIASYTGSGFGMFLIIMGVLNVLGGNFVGGMLVVSYWDVPSGRRQDVLSTTCNPTGTRRRTGQPFHGVEPCYGTHINIYSRSGRKLRL
jgi:Zn-dependent protease